MELQKIKQGKRAFWFFFLLSACLWLIPFFVRVYFIDLGGIESLPKEEGLQPHTPNAVTQITQQLNEGNKFYAFSLMFWNNIKVCIINIVGGAMLGIITTISLLQNGFFTADVMSNVYHNGMAVKDIIKHTLPHSVELLGAWLSGAIGFSFAKIIIDYMRGKAMPCKRFIKFLAHNALIVLLITLIAAFIEVYISVSIK